MKRTSNGRGKLDEQAHAADGEHLRVDQRAHRHVRVLVVLLRQARLQMCAQGKVKQRISQKKMTKKQKQKKQMVNMKQEKLSVIRKHNMNKLVCVSAA